MRLRSFDRRVGETNRSRAFQSSDRINKAVERLLANMMLNSLSIHRSRFLIHTDGKQEIVNQLVSLTDLLGEPLAFGSERNRAVRFCF